MSHEEVQAWLDDYVEAWRTYDPASIAALFAEDATYAYHPWDDRLHGRDAIVSSWLEDRDPAGSWEARYRPELVAGDRAVATGTTTYANGDVYWNLWMLGFDEGGRCRDFVEWFMLTPSDETR